MVSEAYLTSVAQDVEAEDENTYETGGVVNLLAEQQSSLKFPGLVS